MPCNVYFISVYVGYATGVICAGVYRCISNRQRMASIVQQSDVLTLFAEVISLLKFAKLGYPKSDILVDVTNVLYSLFLLIAVQLVGVSHLNV